MHDRSERDVLQRKRVAYQDVGFGPAHDLLADLEANRLNDVALLPVGIVDESNARAAVWIIFNGRNGRRNAVLVALEIDHAELLLMASALVADGHATGAVASTGARLDREQI